MKYILSILLMFPLVAMAEKSTCYGTTSNGHLDNGVHLPTNPLNKLGYDIEFDKSNEFEGLRIDYEALAAHIVTLHKRAIKEGHDLWRVIFDPELQPNLYKTKYSDYLKKNIRFSKKRSWVRHDEHYHVDFEIPCN